MVCKRKVSLVMIYSYATPLCRYYIIVHELAHNTTPFHDEHHELLIAAMSSRFLQRLHDVDEVREYFRCAQDY